MQIEFGLAPAGTILYLDNLQVFDTTAGPAPPMGAPTTGGGPTPPPAGTTAVVAATSENFEGPGAPKFSVAAFAGAGATASFAGGAAAVTVVKPSTEQWHLQFKGPSFQLDATKTYTISVTVSSSAPATVVLLWLQEAPTIAPIAPKGFAVGATPATITLPGVKPPAGVGPFHVQFEFGTAAAGTVITFDNIVVTAA